ncbi:hypothetical protein GCM10007385_08560 [Tateyamaria omphalii]|nr:hypothetical protein GCM10007385_08560 [Tateyamaria omphalii]
MPDHAQIMCDDHEGQPKVAGQIAQQIDHLRLHRDIQRRDWFIPNDKPWTGCQSARDPDPLSLATTKLVWIPVCMFPAQANLLQQLSYFGATVGGG